ncbi:HDL338Wp [Eremothecium sinecaudum]|uniref:HDL338Wp n=1 Tax=Eremothecium sinecaudum TaxID=45286 RepID=A0A0X8HS23_9SACH|nr:HDL338Wp [Eremothecium sinecaudum]AMD20406.1 HDL338Wp [Eremothecium sinecaudum]
MDKIPEHLTHLLETSKYLHLGTCSKDCVPSVSLMNYTYFPPHKAYNQQAGAHYIIFPVMMDSNKYHNIVENPKVSVLIHDWVTAKKLSLNKTSVPNTPNLQPTENQEVLAPSKLLNLLEELNQAELSQMSGTLRGLAEVVDPQSEESSFYQKALLKANPDAQCFIEGENIAIVKVQIQGATVSDSKNKTSVYQ